MLCLGRKKGQRVIIEVDGKKVVVTVILVDRGKVRLGFEADTDVAINREEVLEEPCTT